MLDFCNGYLSLRPTMEYKYNIFAKNHNKYIIFYLEVEFLCPENNGFFPDPEQCDKYYECVDNIPETKFCPDGLLFEASDPNSELCDYPFNVDCGDREFVRKFLIFFLY